MVLSTNVLVISSKQELVVQKDDNLLRDASNDTNPGLAAIKKYQKHPNILQPKNILKNAVVFIYIIY